MTSSSYILGWITHSRTTVDLGAIAADMYILRASCHVTEAFNSDGTDTITVGTVADTDAYITSIDSSSTGIKTATLGVKAGYNSTAAQIKIYYVAGGSSPTTGKALIIIELTKVPNLPS